MLKILRVPVFCFFICLLVVSPAHAESLDTLQLKAEWEALRQQSDDSTHGKRFAVRLATYLTQEALWDAPLPTFNGISDVFARGGALRIISWAHPTPAREWVHIGLIVKPRRGGGVICIPLHDRQLPVGSGLIDEAWLTAQTQADDWVGAVYFDAKAFPLRQDTAYILLGVAGSNAFVTRRIIETLQVMPDGRVAFGLPIIAQGQKRLGRIMMSHSARVGMEINFVEGKNQVLIDHLSPASGEYVGMPSHYGPDFSYDALELTRSGVWTYSMNVDPQLFNKHTKRKPGENARVGKGDSRLGSYKPNWK